VLAGILAYVTARRGPLVQLTALGSRSLAAAYRTLECPAVPWPGADLGSISDSEQYTYSAVWLLYGVALLASRHLGTARFPCASPRRCDRATVLKVFLVDMSDLTGIYRALSFLGLARC